MKSEWAIFLFYFLFFSETEWAKVKQENSNFGVWWYELY